MLILLSENEDIAHSSSAFIESISFYSELEYKKDFLLSVLNFWISPIGNSKVFHKLNLYQNARFCQILVNMESDYRKHNLENEYETFLRNHHFENIIVPFINESYQLLRQEVQNMLLSP